MGEAHEVGTYTSLGRLAGDMGTEMNNDGEIQNQVERAEEFASLLSKHARHIYSYIVTLVPRGRDANSIFRNTVSIMWQNFEEFGPDTNFRAWAFQIAYYRTMAFLARQKRQNRATVSVGSLGNECLQVLSDEIIAQQNSLEIQHEVLAECMRDLSEEDRMLLKRCYTPHVTVQQVAEELGWSTEAAYKALRRLHQRLFDRMETRLRKRE
jgi:RNA polymerase sigma-70 factor, ECF subfamily